MTIYGRVLPEAAHTGLPSDATSHKREGRAVAIRDSLSPLPVAESPVRRLRIGCDVDGVISDLVAPMLTFNQRLGKIPPDARPSDVVEYDWRRTWPDVSFDCFHSPGFWLSPMPFPGARVFIDRLRRYGSIDFVSDCPNEVERSAWLRRHEFSPDGAFHNVKAQHKSAFAREMDYDLFIEDRPDTLIALTGAIRRVYGVVQPYNARLAAESRPASAYPTHANLFMGSLSDVLARIARDFTGGLFEQARASQEQRTPGA